MAMLQIHSIDCHKNAVSLIFRSEAAIKVVYIAAAPCNFHQDSFRFTPLHSGRRMTCDHPDTLVECDSPVCMINFLFFNLLGCIGKPSAPLPAVGSNEQPLGSI